MITVHLTEAIACRAEKAIAELSNHAQLGRFFNAKFKVLSESPEPIRREVTLRGQRFVEIITYQDDLTICYQIEGKGPVKHHRAQIEASDTDSGCLIDYIITCQALPFQPDWLVKAIIQYDIKRALNKLRSYCNER